MKKLTEHHIKDRKLLELKVNGKFTNNPGEVVEALNYYFIDSVATIAQCFSSEYTDACTVNTMELAFSIKNVTESEVTRMIRSLRITNPITKIINLSIS